MATRKAHGDPTAVAEFLAKEWNRSIQWGVSIAHLRLFSSPHVSIDAPILTDLAKLSAIFVPDWNPAHNCAMAYRKVTRLSLDKREDLLRNKKEGPLWPSRNDH